jgi:hypothetical protein
MNSNNSLGLFLTKQDHVVALAAYRNICSRAIGMAIFAAQAVIKGDAETVDNALEDHGPTLEARNAVDEVTGGHNGYADDNDQNKVDAARTGREPPVGLAPSQTPRERLKDAATLYATALDRCQRLATNQYDLPQDLRSRMDWTISRAAEAMKTRPIQLTSTAEKLAFAAKVSQAQRDHQFWRDHGDDVEALVAEAIDNVELGDPDQEMDALDFLSGVDAHQYAIQAGIGVQNTRVRLEIALQRFPAHTMVGRNMISDLGALEKSLPAFETLIDQLEQDFAGEIQSAVMAGRNLLSTESVQAAYATAVDRAVTRAIDTQNAFAVTA